MKVNIMAAGSRGDVQPMVALGVGLARAGHDVTLCAGDDFEGFVTSHGLTFVPAGVRIDELIASPLGVDWLGHSSRNPFHELAALRRFVRVSTQGYAGALVPLAGSADLWVSGVLTVHAVDALVSVGGGRHVVAEFAPMRPTRSGSATMQPTFPKRSSMAKPVHSRTCSGVAFSTAARSSSPAMRSWSTRRPPEASTRSGSIESS